MERKLKSPAQNDPVFLIIASLDEDTSSFKTTIHHLGAIILKENRPYYRKSDGTEERLPQNRIGGKGGSLQPKPESWAIAYSAEDAGVLAARILTQCISTVEDKEKRRAG